MSESIFVWLSWLVSWTPFPSSLRSMSNYMLHTNPTHRGTSPLPKTSTDPRISPPNYSLAFGRNVPVRPETLCDAFTLAVSKCSTYAAIEHVDCSISYEDLDADNYRLATSLLSYDVGRGTRVCLLAERGIPFVTGIFAILKTGASYIPLDGNITTDHQLRFILEDANPTLFLCSRRFLSRASRFSDLIRVAVLEDLLLRDYTSLCNPRSDFLSTICMPPDEAYVIYTSGIYKSSIFIFVRYLNIITKFQGTTGKPKGVSVSHRNITNRE